MVEGELGLRIGRDLRQRTAEFQRFPQPVRAQREVRPRPADPRVAVARSVPESGGAEPRRAKRQGRELPGRRRVPDSCRTGLGCEHRRVGHIQGVRRPFEFHADHHRRSCPAESEARSQHA